MVLNLDNAETAALAGLKVGQAITYSLNSAQADLFARAGSIAGWNPVPGEGA